MKCRVYGYQDLGGRPRRAEIAISTDRYEEITHAQEKIIIGLQFEEKLDLLLENYVEWEAALLTLAQRYIVWPGRSHDEAMDERLELDRRLVNLLTACRLYLDQAGHTLSQFFGPRSAQEASIDKSKSTFYDNVFGYRFMEAIRNHIQHRALPIAETQYWHSADDRPDLGRVEVVVIPCVNVADLKSDPKFKPQIIEELKGRTPMLDLRGPVREYVSCLMELHETMRGLLDAVVVGALDVYKRARLDYSTIDGVVVDLPSLIRVQDEVLAQPFEETPLSLGPIDRYEALRKRRAGAKTLNRFFASNSLRKN